MRLRENSKVPQVEMRGTDASAVERRDTLLETGRIVTEGTPIDNIMLDMETTANQEVRMLAAVWYLLLQAIRC